MEAKYATGQKVRIISVQDKCLKAKHPYIEEYAFQTGAIAVSYWYGVNESYRIVGEHPHVIGYYIYDVRLDRDRQIYRAISEDALEPLASVSSKLK